MVQKKNVIIINLKNNILCWIYFVETDIFKYYLKNRKFKSTAYMSFFATS